MSRRLTFWPRRSRVSRVGGIAGAVVVAGVLVFTAAAAGAGSAGSAGPPPASRQDPTPPAPARPYQIPLPSRTLTPLGGLNVVAITGGATTGRIHYLLQLNELPNAPTRAAFLDGGVSLLTYMGGTTYVASSDASAVAPLVGNPAVRWAGPFDRLDKVASLLARGDVRSWARRAGAKAVVSVTLQPDVTPASIRTALARFGTVMSEEPVLPATVLLMPVKDVLRLAALDGVQHVDVVDNKLVRKNDLAQVTAKFDKVWATYNDKGSNVVGLIEDAGLVDTTHPDFQTGGAAPLRIIETEPGTAVDDHATHVGGIFAGDGTNSVAQGPAGSTANQYSGHAPLALIRSFVGNGTMLGTNADLTNDFTTAMKSTVGPIPGIDLATMSLGSTDSSACNTSGLYTATAIQMDGFVRGAINGADGKSQPLIFTIAAGNERGIYNPVDTPICADYVSLDSPAAAKNPIIVGNVHSDSRTITRSSSWGPTQDGRLKPDISAPGCSNAQSIMSTIPGGGYGPKCGTSMATPLVAAVNALVIQEWRKKHTTSRPTPSTAKAILIHTAAPASAPSSLTTNLAGANNDINFIDLRGGAVGTDLVVRYVNPNAANRALSFSYSPDGKTLTVNLATDPAKAIETTANDIVSGVDADAANSVAGSGAFEAHLAFGGDITKPFGGNLGTGVVTAMPPTNMSGGGVVTGPDYRTGWGMVDAEAAVKLVADDAANQRIRTASIDTTAVDSYKFYSDGTADSKVTLAWDDPPGTAAQVLVNNLDVRLIDPDGTVYKPLVLDPTNPSAAAVPGNDTRNNVEQAIGTKKAGTWTVKVFGTAVAQGPQEYSLVMPPSNTIDAADAETTEGDTGTTNLDFKVNLAPANPDLPVTVDYGTIDGTATVASGDYQFTSGTLTFPKGTTGPQTVSVPIIGDTTPEDNETLKLHLFNAKNAVIGRADAIGTIADNDGTLKYDVIAKSGTTFTYTGSSGTPTTATISSLGTGPSINKSGNVGFMANFTVGSGALIGTGPGAYRLLSVNSVVSTRRFSNFVQINDKNLVGEQDQASGSTPATKWRVWDGNGTTTGRYAVIANGGIAETGRSRAEFDAVFAPNSINNNIDVSQVNKYMLGVLPDFTYNAAIEGLISSGLGGGASGVVAVPQPQWVPPAPNKFWQMPIDDSSTPRPQIADDGRTVVRFRPASWAAIQRYVVGEEVAPSLSKRAASPFLMRVIGVGPGGTSASIEPGWPAPGDTAPDRDITWENTGLPIPSGDSIRIFSKTTSPTTMTLPYTDVAGTADGFALGALPAGTTLIGRAPGISDDGQAIAFYGRNDGTHSLTNGPGIFVSVEKTGGTRALLRIAGVAGNGILDPGETYVDTNGNGQFDPPTEVDVGPFAAFDDLQRVGISSFNAKDRAFTVVFAACKAVPVGSTACSSALHKAIYRIRVTLVGFPNVAFDRYNPQKIEVGPVSVVVQTGDRIQGFDPTAPTGNDKIADVNIYDPINSRERGDVTFWAKDVGGKDGIFRANSPDPAPVIFVPGVSGSVLVDAKFDSDPSNDSELWPGSPIRGFRPDYTKLIVGANVDVRIPDIVRYVGATGNSATPGLTTQPIYGPFIEALQNEGYKPYDLGQYGGNVTFCDYTNQKANKPNLFVFPYDWRLDNRTNSARLANYVACVRQFYPNQKVNIVTHSMGSLLTRRYIMDNPTAKDSVNSVVTIAGPWLGGPKLPYVTETGNFVPGWIAAVDGDGIRQAVASMPAAAELGPSKAYYDLGGVPAVGEDGREWDVPPDANPNETYNYFRQINWLDARNPASTPGTVLDQFHQLPVNGNYQDDWSHDTTGINYFHLYGVQAQDSTIGSLRATTFLACLNSTAPVECHVSEKINLRFTNGDGTVPALSAVRRTSTTDLNAPTAKLFPFISPSPAADPTYDHTALVSNPKVQDKIFEILGQQDDAGRSAPPAVPAPTPLAPTSSFSLLSAGGGTAKSAGGSVGAALTVAATTTSSSEPAPLPRESRYVTIDNATSLVVNDGAGRSTQPDLTGNLADSLPGISIYPESSTSAIAIIPAGGSYNTTFTTTGQPLEIEVRLGAGDTTSAVQRYVDIAVPAGAKAMLASTSTGTADLQLDTNGDGIFETTVAPTATATGAAAADTAPPEVSVTQASATGGVQITLTATDASAGVKDILYSLNGTSFLTYSAPFVVDPALVPSIIVIADDNIGNRSAPQTFTVQAATQPPVAVDGTATTPEDTPVTVTLSASSASGAPLTYAVATPPVHGTLDVVGDQATYTPAANFNGSDSFTFTASDGKATSAAATVAITVSPVNDVPVAGSASVALVEDSAGVAVDLLALASDVETPVSGLTFVVVSGPSKGTLSGSGGSLTYTPVPNANGTDSFTYSVTDRGDPDGCSVLVVPCAGSLSSAAATVTLSIAPVNDPPVAVPDSVTTAEDTPVQVPVLANDSDPDGDALVVTGVGAASHGTVVLGVDGSVAYTPATDYNGPDSFSYTISDGNAGTASATVSVDVTPVNDPPVAVDDAATVLEDGSVVVDALANDSAGPANELGQTLSFVSVGTPAHGAVVVEAGKLRYTPAPDYNGPDSFSYTVSDGALTAVATVSVDVAPVNDPPVAVDDAATVPEDGSTVIDVLANDTPGPPDEAAQQLDASILTAPQHGLAVVVTFGPDAEKVAYLPAANYNGPDSFTYLVCDGGNPGVPRCSIATVTVTVSPVNDLPVASSVSVALVEDAAGVPVGLSGSDLETPSTGLTYSVVSEPSKGTLSGSGASLTYTPTLNANGTDSFTYLVTDRGDPDGCSVLVAPCAGSLSSAVTTVTLQIAPVNDPPVAVADAATVVEDGSILVDALANDSAGPPDESGQTLTLTAVGTPVHGAVAIEAGKLRYTPALDYNGPDSFSYSVSDGSLTAAGTVSVDVTPVNDPPVAANDAATVAEDGTTLIDALANDSAGPANESGQTLSFASVGTPAHGTVTVEAGKLRYTPAHDYNGPDSFSYTISDGSGGTASASVAVDVTPVNDPPVAANDAVTVAEDGSTVVDVLANDTPGPPNESAQTLSLLSVGSPTHGTATVEGGKVHYVPEPNYNGPDSFAYTTSDGGLTASATVTVTITPVNDPPVATSDVALVVEDGSVLVDALANDVPGPANESGQLLTLTSVGAPAHGTATIEAGELRYSPAPDYNGPDSFTYIVCDDGTTAGAPDALCATGTVAVTATEVNDPPVAGNDSATVAEDGSVLVDVVTGDITGPADEFGQTLTLTATGAAAHGTVASESGKVRYTPAHDYNGADQFTYTVCDNGTTAGILDSRCASGVVDVSVSEVNDAPVAAADSATVDEGGTTLVDELANDSAGPVNESGQTLRISTVSAPAHGTATIESGKLRYTPAAGYTGSDSFGYTVCDNGTTAGAADPLCASTVVTIDVSVGTFNHAPSATDGSVSLNEDAPPVPVDLGALVSDAETADANLTYTIVTPPTKGLLSGTGPVLAYDSNPNANGPDSFTYSVTDRGRPDGCGAPGLACDAPRTSAVRTVAISIAPVNDPPAISLPTVVAAPEGGTTSLTASATDVDGDPLTYTWTSEIGTLTATGANATVAVADGPAAGFVRVTATDPSGATATAEIRLDVPNAPPTATFTSDAAVQEGQSFHLSLTNPRDPSPADQAVGFTYAFNCGDGSGYGAYSANPTATCPATAAGTRSVSGRIRDKDGGVTEYTGSVAVNGLPPVATFTNDGPVDESLPFHLSVSVTPAAKAANYDYAFDCGEGSGFGAYGSAAAKACPTDDNGTRAVRARLRARDGSVYDYTGSVVVRNLPPSANAGLDASVYWGVAAPFVGVVTDPSVTDQTAGLSPTWTWGDGSPLTYGIAPTHTFANPGTFTATLKATDKDGASAVDSAVVTVKKRETSIAYTGSTSASFGYAVLSATLADSVDPLTAQLINKTVIFTVGTQLYTAKTDATGAAVVALAAPIPAGTYAVSVRFAADTRYLASTSATTTLKIGSSSGSATGVSLIPASGGNASFSVSSDGTTTRGTLDYTAATTTVHATTLAPLGIAANGRSAWFSGVSTTGQQLRIYVEDGPGATDIFKLWVNGVPQTGTGALTAGDVQIVRLA